MNWKHKLRNRRQYNKNIRATRRALKKWARKWAPYDWSYLTDPIKISLQGMLEYYELGYNVHALDFPEMPSRAEMCKYLLNKYQEFEDSGSWAQEEEKWSEFCNLFRAYVRYLWD